MLQDKRIVIINGSGGVGKDTFVEMCNRYAYTKNISSVDIVKEVAKMFGWDGMTKDEKTRKFLSDLKLLSTDYSNSPFEYMKSEIEFFKITPYKNDKYLRGVIFCHVREPQEIQKMKDAFDCKSLLITNNRVEQVITNMADAGVYDFKYDYAIPNNGSLAELQSRALNFLVNIFDTETEIGGIL